MFTKISSAAHGWVKVAPVSRLLYVIFITGRFHAFLTLCAVIQCLLMAVKHPRRAMVAPQQHVALTRVNVHAPAVATVRRTGRQG
jgi:hypothetical protein